MFIAVGGVGGSLYLYEPFESSRPKEVTIDGFQTGHTNFVHARAWQDPFMAIDRSLHGQASIKNTESDPNSISLKLPQSISLEDSGKLLIVPVMVYGGNYSEDVENRRRRRYAVLSALANKDYQLYDSEKIGYFEFPPGDQSNGRNKASQFIIPYEWLHDDSAHYEKLDGPEENPPPVLLLWLDERQFRDNPLSDINEVLSSIEQNEVLSSIEQKVNGFDLNVALIGPAGSSLLKKMVSEAYNLAIDPKNGNYAEIIKNFNRWEFAIFSPTATASANLILNQSEKTDIETLLKNGKVTKCGDKHMPSCPYAGLEHAKRYTNLFLIEQIFYEIGINFFRTTTSDKFLARELIEQEFKNRNISFTNDNDVVVLISEWDTFYGRALPAVFKNVFKDEDEGQDEDQDKKSDNATKITIKSYYYMRGLDGEIVPISKNAKRVEDNLPKESQHGERSAHELERAVGVNRFDYLRRLSRKIKNEISRDSGNVRVIGVLGSDVYDKLLVLQAMRSSFPNALFFTTDADARYEHPAEYDWARNLIVMSAFGLTMDQNEPDSDFICPKKNKKPLKQNQESRKKEPKIQLSTFRDSYQTAIFVSTLIAVCRAFPEGSSQKSNNLPDDKFRQKLAEFLSEPKSFEVGRFQLVPLTGGFQESGGKWAYLKNTPWVGLSVLSYVFLVFLSVELIRRQRIGRVQTGAVALLAICSVAALVAIYFVDGKPGEPLPLLSGVNSLPTIAILSLTLMYSLYFIAKGQNKLKNNGAKLTENFILKEDIVKTSPFQNGWEILWDRVFALRLLQVPNIDTKSVWALDQQAANRVLYRSFFLAVLSTGFAVLLMTTDYLEPPVRGEHYLYLYYITVLPVLLFFFWSLHFVVDHMLLSHKLANFSATTRQLWSLSTIEIFAERRGMEINVSNEEPAENPEYLKDSLMGWLSIKVLAERTQTIENCLYYPFIILLGFLAAHSTLFDNWHFFPSIIVVMAVSVSFIIAFTFLLHRSVKVVRETSIETMQNSKSQCFRFTNNNAELEQLQLLIDEVKNERRGAFSSFVSNPLLKALLMPSGGVGGLYLLEYLGRVG